MRILGICGSQRDQSANKSLLRASQRMLLRHEWTDFNIFSLPFFDPHLQYSDKTPLKVLELRKFATQADLIIISTPEYAHSAPGVLKNALEWMFHEGTQKKPVVVLIGSGHGEHTKSQLIETLNTMDFITNDSQTLLIQGVQMKIDEDSNFLDTELEKELRSLLIRMTDGN
jgi:chromate reductase